MEKSHFVATGFVVFGRKTLLLYHRKLGMWLPPGGHIEDGELPEEALLREIKEETGIDAEVVSPKARPDPPEKGIRFLHVPSHVQLEEIPGHPMHIDLIYFCRAKSDRVGIRPAEHENFGWYSARELRAAHVREEVRRSGVEAIKYVTRLTNRRKTARIRPAPTGDRR